MLKTISAARRADLRGPLGGSIIVCGSLGNPIRRTIRCAALLTVLLGSCFWSACKKAENQTQEVFPESDTFGGRSGWLESPLGDNPQEERWTGDMAENAESSMGGSIEAGMGQGMEAQSWEAARAVVRLSTGSASGSGVIFRADKARMVVATAAHVVREADEVWLELADGSMAQSRAVWVSDGADLGFVWLEMEELSIESRETLRYAATDKETFERLAEGEEICVIGSRDGVAVNVWRGELVDPWIYTEDFGQYMMWGKIEEQRDRDEMSGMSGSGVFDTQGYLIGILCGGNEKNEVVVLPWSIIQSEYELLFGS
ncbi:MAG: serine protease [Clostridium sp.]|jgi:S1-C subfamily serine protease|nr:serine protease [Clostridium sp.]